MRGPGQNAKASFSAGASNTACCRAASMSRTWTISGLIAGRALAAKIAADRRIRGRVRREAVDRLGRHGDKAAGAKALSRGGDCVGVRWRKARHLAIEQHPAPLSRIARKLACT